MSDEKFKGKYRIKSARASWHDYNGGAYFITICTKNRVHYFGENIDGEMVLSEIGEYCAEQFRNVSSHYPYAIIPLFVILPNHIHAIVIICENVQTDGCRRVGVHAVSTTTQTANNRWKSDHVDETMQYISRQKGRLSVSIGGLKRAVTRYANQHAIDFAWQTRFYDRIIRDDNAMNHIIAYIENNVAKWNEDELYSCYLL